MVLPGQEFERRRRRSSFKLLDRKTDLAGSRTDGIQAGNTNKGARDLRTYVNLILVGVTVSPEVGTTVHRAPLEVCWQGDDGSRWNVLVAMPSGVFGKSTRSTHEPSGHIPRSEVSMK